MRILITGANGFIGQALCPALAAAGHAVTAAVRRPATFATHIAVQEVPDIVSEIAWVPSLEKIDAIVHLAARVHILQEEAEDPLTVYRRVNVEGTRLLAEKARDAGVKRLIFLSSVKVHGEDRPQPYSETDPPTPQDPYAASKWEAEQTLWKTLKGSATEAVVLRPPLVYGPCVRGNFLTLLRLCELGVPLPFGSVHNRRSLIGVDNLVDAIRHCLTHPKAGGETFLVSDGEDVSTPELIRRIARAMGKRIYLPPFPPALLRNVLRLAGKEAVAHRLLGSLTLDCSHIRDALGWRPPEKLDAGLRKTADWYRTRKRSGRAAGSP